MSVKVVPQKSDPASTTVEDAVHGLGEAFTEQESVAVSSPHATSIADARDIPCYFPVISNQLRLPSASFWSKPNSPHPAGTGAHSDLPPSSSGVSLRPSKYAPLTSRLRRFPSRPKVALARNRTDAGSTAPEYVSASNREPTRPLASAAVILNFRRSFTPAAVCFTTHGVTRLRTSCLPR